MALAFSYIRFSSEKQKFGDSVRRQLKLAEDYAALHSLTLDTKSYRDLGVSAFRGKNAVEGRLGTFLRAVEKEHSKISPGSYLLIEALDRLSRNEVDEAFDLFMKIIRKGITIVTLNDGQEYSKARIKADHGISLVMSIMHMSRAHEESATKSNRVKAAWARKKENASSGKIITAMAPAWLKPNAERTGWDVDQAKAAVVLRIFEMALQGSGCPAIAKLLNSEKVPTMQRAAAWSFATVNAILKNEAVIGKFVPKKAVGDSIHGYYPLLLEESKFQLTQESLKQRKWIGGRSAEFVTNLFAGYSFCYGCGSRMRIVGTSTVEKQSGEVSRHSYLKCQSAYDGSGCSMTKRFPYTAAETAILRYMADDMSQQLADT